MIRSMSLTVVLIVGAALLFAGVGFAQQSSPVVEVTRISISPQAPPVGTNYTVSATVYSRHSRPVVVRGRIQVPQGDIVTKSPGDITIPPGATVTLSWTVYCGVEGGTVRVAADIVREVR